MFLLIGVVFTVVLHEGGMFQQSQLAGGDAPSYPGIVAGGQRQGWLQGLERLHAEMNNKINPICSVLLSALTLQTGVEQVARKVTHCEVFVRWEGPRGPRICFALDWR